MDLKGQQEKKASLFPLTCFGAVPFSSSVCLFLYFFLRCPRFLALSIHLSTPAWEKKKGRERARALREMARGETSSATSEASGGTELSTFRSNVFLQSESPPPLSLSLVISASVLSSSSAYEAQRVGTGIVREKERTEDGEERGKKERRRKREERKVPSPPSPCQSRSLPLFFLISL